MKDSNLSQNACVCADEDKTTLPERMRAHVQWMWSVVSASCGATQS